MAKFNEYTQKATPADNDTMMIYDATSKANKLSPFSGIWNWIVGKLTNAVISNLQTSNKSVIGALNELNGGLPAGGIYDLDNPPKKMLFLARAGSTNFPNGFVGANAVAVIQMNLGNSDYNSMIAFTFVVDKIAIRRKSGTKNWSEWKYFNTVEILSNLTTTNKSSLVGAINELNSKTSKLALEENVTNIQALISKASSGTCILFHLSGANYVGNDLPIGEKYKYGSGIIFYRNSNSCKIVLFPEEMKPVWKMANWAKWKDFANNIVD